MDPGSTPTGVGHAHVADEIAHFLGYSRTTVVDSTLPSPIEAESSSVPGDDGLRLHDQQGRAPARPQPPHPNAQNTVGRPQGNPMVAVRTLQYEKLMPQRQDLGLERSASAQAVS